MAKCVGCNKQTWSNRQVCDECIDPCRTTTGNGPPVPTDIPVGICTYIDLDDGCVYFRDGCGGGFPTKVCPPKPCAMPAKPVAAGTVLRGCDDQAYSVSPDALVKDSKTEYTHTDILGNVQKIYIPHLDFCFVANDNCPSDGHRFSAECTEGLSNYRWEFSEDCQTFVPMGEGETVDTTLTECGGHVRLTGDDPSGESWCITREVPATCCAIVEGEDETDSLALFGGCYIVPPGFMCGYWFGDFANVLTPDDPPNNPARQIVLDNSDQNCPAIYRLQVETVGQQFAEVSPGGPSAEFFPLYNDVKMQVRIHEAGDPWINRKFLSLYSSNDGQGSGIAGPTDNNTCRRYVSEAPLCAVPTRNYIDWWGDPGPGDSLQHDFRVQAAIVQNVEILMQPCEVATFEINPILYWNQADAGSGNNLYYERWHLSISAKVRREVCK